MVMYCGPLSCASQESFEVEIGQIEPPRERHECGFSIDGRISISEARHDHFHNRTLDTK